MSETGQNFRALPQSTLAIAWPRVAADIARIRDPHPLVTVLPASKLTEVDLLAVNEAVLVRKDRAELIVGAALRRRPGARFVAHPKTEKLIVIERTA